MNKLIILLAAAIALGGLSCDKGKSGGNKAANTKPDIKTGVAPVADPDIAVIEMENPAYGTIKMELYSNIAPQMVARFKQLAKDGYYEGIIFHRVNDTVIQAGNADTKPGRNPNGMKEGDSGKPNVPAEFSDVPYDTGIVGAARLGNDVNSQNAQFFIMLKREAAFDKGYTVFGKVIDGMNNVRTIAGAPRQGEKPTDPIRIKKITIVPRS
jgi:peptidylprolyl isomerase